MLENVFQAVVIRDINNLFPDDCYVIPMDGNYIQGFPDILILYEDKWAVLECKKSDNEPFQPNQEYYLETMGCFVYSAVIYPENKEEVLHELQHALSSRR